MSADNCIAICKFKQGWKVVHCLGIDNIYWWKENGKWIRKNEINPKQLYKIFKNGILCKTREEALQIAKKMWEEIGYVEYGILEIER